MALKIAAIQLHSGPDRDQNLEKLEKWILAAANDGAKLIVTPEYSDVRGSPEVIRAAATPVPGAVCDVIEDLAKRTGCWIHLGSLHQCLEDDSRLGNSGVTFSPTGEIVALYRKIHLYDAIVDGVEYRESDSFAPGSTLNTVEALGFTFGLSICYDVRFCELYRALRALGADVFLIPAAFNVHTGRDHWESLLRARAIENQCYVIAAAQIGAAGPELPCLGRSTIIDPWGTVLACMPDTEGYITSILDLERVKKIRSSLPAWDHRRIDLYGAQGKC